MENKLTIEEIKDQIETFLWVETKNQDVIPFILNNIQGRLIELLNKFIRLFPNKPFRIIILKGRQFGFSTLILAIFFIKCLLVNNTRAAVISHEEDATKRLFKKIKFFAKTLVARPTLDKESEKEYSFPRTNSYFYIGTAGAKSFGRGDNITDLHCCLLPDQKIITKNGKEINVENVKIGQKVITHNGNEAEIKNIFVREWAKNCLEIKTDYYNSSLKLTKNHKVFTDKGFIEAGKLSIGYYVSAPIRKIKEEIFNIKSIGCETKKRKQNGGSQRINIGEIKLDYNFGYFVGYYLAEGSIKYNQNKVPASITFTYLQGEKFILKAINGVKDYICSYKFKDRINTRTQNCFIYSSSLTETIKHYFGAKDDKHIPDWIFNSNINFIKGLLCGYFNGDGSKNQNTIRITSIRESLIYQSRDLLLALNIGFGNISIKEAGFYYGRNCQKQWTLTLCGRSANKLRNLLGYKVLNLSEYSKRGEKFKIINNKIFFKIKEIKEFEYSGKVYDFEVDHHDHSFLTNTISVSNSEVAFWKNAGTIMNGLMQAVGMTGNAIIETTANGVGDYFQKLWKKSWNNPDSAWKALFFKWTKFAEYEMDPGPNFIRTEHEEYLIKQHPELNNRKLAWRRWKISETEAEPGFTPEQIFQREYPLTQREAFISSGKSAFSLKALESYKTKPPVDIEDGWQIWKRPSGYSIMAIDPSEGLENKDRSIIDIYDENLEQVAQWAGWCDTDELGEKALLMAGRYKSYIIPEINSLGIAVINVIKKKYPHSKIYHRESFDEEHKTIVKKLGWRTTTITKARLVADEAVAIRTHAIKINCAETVDEMMSFIKNGRGGYEADEGANDDRVITAGLAIQAYNDRPPSKRTYSPEEQAKIDIQKQNKQWRKRKIIKAKLKRLKSIYEKDQRQKGFRY
jgi:intein/homing endonuclease